MNEDTSDVKEGAESTVPTDHQADITASPKEDDKVERNVYDKVREAMQTERKERKKLQADLKYRKANEDKGLFDDKQVQPSVDERVLKAEANSLIAIKLAQDPAFKDRMSLVQDEMEISGKGLEDADSAIKARLYDQVSAEMPQLAQAQQLPTQLTSSATQEQSSFQPSGDVIKDITEDPNTPPELKEAMNRKFR